MSKMTYRPLHPLTWPCDDTPKNALQLHGSPFHPSQPSVPSSGSCMASAHSIPFRSAPFRSGVPFCPRDGSVLSSSPFRPSLLQQLLGAPSPTCTGALWIKSGHYHPNLINPARIRFREPRIDVSADVIASGTSSSPRLYQVQPPLAGFVPFHMLIYVPDLFPFRDTGHFPFRCRTR